MARPERSDDVSERALTRIIREVPLGARPARQTTSAL